MARGTVCFRTYSAIKNNFAGVLNLQVPNLDPNFCDKSLRFLKKDVVLACLNIKKIQRTWL